MCDWRAVMAGHGQGLAMVRGAEEAATGVHYDGLLRQTDAISSTLASAGVGAGAVVGFAGQYSTANVATLLAVADLGAVAVPLPDDSEQRIVRLLEIAGATHRLISGDRLADETGDAGCRVDRRSAGPIHPLYRSLVDAGHPGLVLFTSGTTGDPKAAVQDLHGLRSRYDQPRTVGKMLAFMRIDHIGGINTLLYVLSHGGTLVVPASRSPADVAASIERHRIEVLPVSPTFLNLMLLSGVCERYDLSSLRRITYGSEPMPMSVLRRVGEVLPNVELLQTYGTTEVGILKSKSECNGSLWMKVGGEGYETKVVDGRLRIRAATAMLGYLNADSPFDADGFMDTGDQVEIRGEWIRVLGRKSEFINVGGTKVSPVEVESVLLEMPEVAEAGVHGQSHPLMGQIVAARIRLREPIPSAEFKSRMRAHCRDQLPAEAVPVKVMMEECEMVTERFKRERG